MLLWKRYGNNKMAVILHLQQYSHRLNFFLWRCCPTRPMAYSFTRFLDHTQRRTTFGRTPLDEWSIRYRVLYLTTQYSQQTNVHAPPGGFRTHNLSWRAAAHPRLRPRGHWDRLSVEMEENSFRRGLFKLYKNLVRHGQGLVRTEPQL